MSTKGDYTTGTVASTDGTTIGYRRLGAGPAAVLLHGGVNASQHMMTLGRLLADAFTVYLPDRRGRGASGPIGSGYSIEREDEDVGAVVRHSGARCVFGPADGGLFALHSALTLPQATKVAAYEPLLFVGQPGIEDYRRLFVRMQALLRAGRSGEALIYSAQQTTALASRAGQFSTRTAAALRAIPARSAGRLCDLLLRCEPKRGDHVPWRELLPALAPELVMESEGPVEEYRLLDAETL